MIKFIYIVLSMFIISGCHSRGLTLDQQLPEKFKLKIATYGFNESQIIGYIQNTDNINSDQIVFTSDESKKEFYQIKDNKQMAIINSEGHQLGTLNINANGSLVFVHNSENYKSKNESNDSVKDTHIESKLEYKKTKITYDKNLEAILLN